MEKHDNLPSIDATMERMRERIIAQLRRQNTYLKNENNDMQVEIIELRARLAESRRALRQLGRIVAEGRDHEGQWRQRLMAAVGLTVAVTSAIYTIIIVAGGWM